jgi:hypothetical protein
LVELGQVGADTKEGNEQVFDGAAAAKRLPNSLQKC